MSYSVIVKEYGVPTYKDAPAVIFSEFLAYVKANKDVWRVVVPQTCYGYGSSLIDSANIEWMDRHYPRAVKHMCFNATISRTKFLQSEELQGIIAGLVEDYPLIDDEIHSRLESEAFDEAWEQWAASEIDSDLSPDELRDVLDYFSTGLYELLQVDNDGATVYMPNSVIESWREVITELSANK